MARATPKPAVVFIVGPTASGKTAAALALAERMPIEVVNADSRQVYRHMSIGTAKPTPTEQAVAPHHLFDIADPDGPFSLGLYLGNALSAISEIQGRGHLPVVVGGTGQYVWALAEGWQVPRVEPQPQLRARLEDEARRTGPEALHARLRGVDPASADAIDPHNVRRVIRAIEVFESTGERSSDERRRQPPPFEPHLAGISLPRPELHRRVDERMTRMLAEGWVDEVAALLAMGYTRELPSFSSAGYRDLAAHLAGEISLDDAVGRAGTAQRSLVRRQSAWFRGDDGRIAWHEAPEALAEGMEAALSA